MGRKAKYGEDKEKKGPGRKARKQKDPIFPKHLLGKFALKIVFITYTYSMYVCI
jgi:hypothetical protein